MKRKLLSKYSYIHNHVGEISNILIKFLFLVKDNLGEYKFENGIYYSNRYATFLIDTHASPLSEFAMNFYEYADRRLKKLNASHIMTSYFGKMNLIPIIDFSSMSKEEKILYAHYSLDYDTIAFHGKYGDEIQRIESEYKERFVRIICSYNSMPISFVVNFDDIKISDVHEKIVHIVTNKDEKRIGVDKFIIDNIDKLIDSKISRIKIIEVNKFCYLIFLDENNKQVTYCMGYYY